MTLATIFKERDNLFLCQIVRTYQWTEESAGPVDPPKPLITMGMLFDMPPLGESLMRWIADGKKCFSFHT
jgi:hypothetical protein